VHGVSMGAATTMCLSGEALPDYVRCFVEDCGYTSVWDEFSGQLSEQFGLPEFPLLYSTSVLCRLVYGWSFGEASPLRQVAKCNRPMLFIHGDADTFVPFSMMQRLYDAKRGEKKMWIAKGTHHAASYLDYPHEYTEKVRDFLNVATLHD
ncbi:MAG: alpha/beta hydrolase, partial [Prevotellaceae bacterium]|nr:alpha/beta hydrolase [Prevotellaceae bacterium]